MLLIRLRVRPCRDRLRRPSSGRLTVTALPSVSIFMLGCGSISSLPLGPSTRILPSAMLTFTPPGMATGCLPIRDMALSRLCFPLPHVTQNFAAQALGPRLPIANHPAIGGDDRDAEAVQDARQLAVAAVNPAAGRAHALDAPNHPFPFRAVLEVDAQYLLGVLGVGRRVELRLSLLVLDQRTHLVVENEAFVLEHLR